MIYKVNIPFEYDNTGDSFKHVQSKKDAIEEAIKDLSITGGVQNLYMECEVIKKTNLKTQHYE
jgi:hypothetical protein